MDEDRSYPRWSRMSADGLAQTGADDLITWLRAQLDEDEQVARAAAESAKSTAWLGGAEGSVFGAAEASDLHVRGAILSLDDVGTHIARWDPARVLAEVDAKRRIIDEEGRAGDDMADGLWVAVQLLALPYADRPGYRDEWRRYV